MTFYCEQQNKQRTVEPFFHSSPSARALEFGMQDIAANPEPSGNPKLAAAIRRTVKALSWR